MRTCFILFALLSLMIVAGCGGGNGVSSLPSGQRRVIISGSAAPADILTRSKLLGRLDPTTSISLDFALPLRNQSELDQLLKQINDPTSPRYGKSLTTEEFIQRFAPTPADYGRVVDYARSQGFTVLLDGSSQTLILVSAPASVVEYAFRVRMLQYQDTDGRKFYAADGDPSLPVSIAALISGIIGLNDAVAGGTGGQK